MIVVRASAGTAVVMFHRQGSGKRALKDIVPTGAKGLVEPEERFYPYQRFALGLGARHSNHEKQSNVKSTFSRQITLEISNREFLSNST
jgi:hypothetical protein